MVDAFRLENEWCRRKKGLWLIDVKSWHKFSGFPRLRRRNLCFEFQIVDSGFDNVLLGIASSPVIIPSLKPYGLYEWMDQWINEWMDQWINGSMDHMNGWVNGPMDQRIDGSYEWMNQRTLLAISKIRLLHHPDQSDVFSVPEYRCHNRHSHDWYRWPMGHRNLHSPSRPFHDGYPKSVAIWQSIDVPVWQ